MITNERAIEIIKRLNAYWISERTEADLKAIEALEKQIPKAIKI